MSLGSGQRGTVIIAALAFQCTLVADAQVQEFSLTRVAGFGEELILAGVTSIRRGPERTLLLVQPGSQGILILDSTGSHLRTVGRQGRGPGEFQYLGPTGAIGDSVWGVDLMTSQVSLFRTNGRTVRAWRVQPPDGGPFNSPVALFADGTALVPSYRRLSPTLSEQLILRTRWDGTQPDTVIRIVNRSTEWLIAARDGKVFSTQPLGDDPMYSASPDGRFVAVVHVASQEVGADSIRVRLLRYDGSPVYDREIPFAHERVTPAKVDSVVAAKTHSLRRRGVPAAAVRKDLYIPTHIVPVSEVLVSTRGFVWLRSRKKHADVRWLVLDAAGELAGRLAVAPRNRILTLDGDDVWGTESDSDGVQTVVRWRLEYRAR